MTDPDDPADEHREIAARFSTTVEGVTPDQWDSPAPPEGWVARDVVAHLVEWFPAFLSGATGIELTVGPDVHADPAGAWHIRPPRSSGCSMIGRSPTRSTTSGRWEPCPCNGRSQ